MRKFREVSLEHWAQGHNSGTSIQRPWMLQMPSQHAFDMPYTFKSDETVPGCSLHMILKFYIDALLQQIDLNTERQLN